MFKVVSAEIKKMVSKPGIYILSAFLALILILGIFIYNPTVYEKTYYTLAGSDFMTKYTNYAIDGRKKEADSYISISTANVNRYFINGKSYKETVDLQLQDYNIAISNYKSCIMNNASQTTISNMKNAVITKLKELNTTIFTGIENNKMGTYSIVTTNENYKVYSTTYTAILTLFNTNDTIENITTEYTNKYQSKFENSISNLYFPTLNDNFVSEYTANTDSRLSIITDRLIEIDNDIEELHNIVNNDSNKGSDLEIKNEMDRLSNLYTNTAKTYLNLVKYELLNNAFNIINTSDKLDLMYLSNEDSFNTSSNLIKYDYLFSNNKTDSDYAHPLTIASTSNPDINAYDYTYFILKVFSFVIIVYAVMSGCHAISGEIKEGSMRYLAIRPVSRTSLFFGKMLSIIFMSVILILFSSIISLLVGGVIYGFDTLPILTIFNGSTAITLHPIGMLSIYLVSLILELTVYLSIAMLLSTLVKSDLFSVTLVLVIYLLNILLPLFIVGPNTWLSFYPFSHINLYSLFGSSLYLLNNNPFASLLGTKVYATTNIFLTISIIALIIIICNIISSRVFKRKEL